MKNIKILVVDDERNICELIRLYLEKEGYSVVMAHDGAEAVELQKNEDPSLILLDIMMPHMDGWEVCRRVRERSSIPIIMLTAKGETFDKVMGLELGADDYIVKPFEILELLARVETVLRRYHKLDRMIEIAGVSIDTRSMVVRRFGEEIPLTRKEYELLLLFARNPGTALYRETIYERVWGGDYFGDSRTIDLHVQRVRKKVGWEDKLQSVYKVGYRLEV